MPYNLSARLFYKGGTLTYKETYDLNKGGDFLKYVYFLKVYSYRRMMISCKKTKEQEERILDLSNIPDRDKHKQTKDIKASFFRLQ